MRLAQRSTSLRELLQMLGLTDWGLIGAATIASGALRIFGAGPAGTLIAMLVAGACTAIAIFDLRYRIIPDLISLTLIFLGLWVCVVQQPEELFGRSLAMSIAVALLLAVRKIHAKLRGADGLGIGDIKLIAAISAWISPVMLPELIFAASLTGLAHAVIVRIFARTPDPAIPFGAHLAVWLWVGVALGVVGST